MKIGLGTSLSANGYPGGYVMPTPNLEAHYDASIPSSITEVTGVSNWADLSGNGRDLIQATGADQPIYSAANRSITFDGVSQFLKAVGFTLNQPESVYFVGQQVSWTSSDSIFDGNAANVMRFYQNGSSPDVSLFAGTAGDPTNTDFALGADAVAACVINGASSTIKVNNNAAVTGNPGAANAGGFTLGARGDLSRWANIIVYEVAIYSVAHDATTQAAIINGLMNKWTI